MTLTVAQAGPAHAAASGEYAISLITDQDDYALNARSYILSDKQGKLTIQDVAAYYNEGKLNYRNTNPEQILLNYEQHPFWIVFSVKNQTASQDWFIDIGGLENGRSGIIDKFLIYEMNQRKIFYDGFQAGRKDNPIIQNSRFIPVTVPAMEEAVFIVYVQPTIFKRVSLNLNFKKNIADTQPSIAIIYVDYIPSLIIASLLIILIGFFVTRGPGFIPLALFYVCLLAWYALIEKPFYTNFPGIGLMSTFYPAIITLIIGTAALLTIPLRYNTSPLRIGLIGFLGFLFAITILTTFVFPIDTDLQSYSTNGFSVFCLIIAAVYLSSNDTYFIRPQAVYFAGWIVLYIVGQVIKLGAFMGYLPIGFYTIHAEYMMLLPQTIVLVIGVIMAIKSDEARKLNAFARQAEKAKTLLMAKKSKEENDHSRLLRVIEREREVMEELRNRESERTEEMRRAKIVADEANQAKSAFLAVVSHEIRTPMTGIMGMIRMLQDTDLSHEQKDYLMTIKDSGDAMLALLNDILDFSKIEGGAMTLENIKFDLPRVLNGVQMLMKGHADQKNLAIRLNIHENVPVKLYGDPTRLRQVILNLVGNALKFTAKGHVGINVFLDPTHEENNNDNQTCAIYFSVEDSGIGISEDAQANLFTPFSQADSSISRKYGGTGLGLSICRRLVDAMGGEIKVKSREGSGTTFFFTLPFDTDLSDNEDENDNGADNQPRELTAAPLPVARKRYLIVDDNEVNRKVVKAFLDKADYESIMIHSGIEALKLLKSDRAFDGIFLDIEMPEMNGREVARKILGDASISMIPIIALTGNIAKSDLKSYKEIGFKGYVAKPVTPEDLLETIDKIENGRSDECFPDDLTKSDRQTTTELSPQFRSEKQAYTEPSSLPKETPRPEPKPDKADTPLRKQPVLGKTLDDKLVQGLKDGLGAKQTIELLEELFIKTDEIIGNLRKAVGEDSMEKVQMRAHELKGMAANFGLKAVSEKASQLEKFSKNNEITMIDVDTHIEDLLTLIERSKLALDDFFSQ